MLDGKLTYISLFSSAGVGCYGFKIEDFLCIATNELLEKRLNIQKLNNKCRFESGYIGGDITKSETKNLVFEEIKRWNKLGNDKVDVVIATPPCQGMSIVNRKINEEKDLKRNSLVVESINLIKEIKPRFFIFENVPAFLTTACTANNGELKEIQEVIKDELGKSYTYIGRTLNFKNYGSASSRTRTIVIGVFKEYSNFISPIELFPDFKKEKTLRESIGHLSSLSNGEISENDFYHQGRPLSDEMISWIENIPEGKSAFDNEDDNLKPHRIIDGNLVINSKKLSSKYTRQYWDRTGPCIHTRNDVIASQNTIHPQDNRVFSIRELMILMSIPETFKWLPYSLEELNSLTIPEKQKILKKEELNIRRTIGEAVPTEIFRQIAHKIKDFALKKHLTDKEIKLLIKEKNLSDTKNMLNFIEKEFNNIDATSICRICEFANIKREETAAYFTDKILLNEIYKNLPDIPKNEIHIIEPAVGIGNFLPFIIKKYENKQVYIDIFDLNKDILVSLQAIIAHINLSQNIHLNFHNKDTLLEKYNKKYDLFVGNPPFNKTTSAIYKNTINVDYTHNLFAYFMELGLKISDYVVLITPKNLLNTPEFKNLRGKISDKKVDCIIDCGELGFKGVLIETICSFINVKDKPGNTKIVSLTNQFSVIQKQNYIFDKSLPYWIIYRDKEFDKLFNNMEFDIFTVFRDRQITNSNSYLDAKPDAIRIIKSRNISDTGEEIINIKNYDAYIDKDLAEKLAVYKYLDSYNVYLVPNMTYYPRMHKKEKGYIVNGSVAVLTLKNNKCITKEDILFYSTDEFRKFYKTARNYQTRSLNIDTISVFWFGKKR